MDTDRGSAVMAGDRQGQAAQIGMAMRTKADYAPSRGSETLSVLAVSRITSSASARPWGWHSRAYAAVGTRERAR